MHRKDLNSISIVETIWIVVPCQFFFNFLNSFLSANKQYVLDYFTISEHLLQLSNQLSTAILTAAASISYLFHAAFGMQRCYLASSFLSILFGILSICSTNEIVFVVFRCLTGFAQGIQIPATSSMTNSIVINGGFSLSICLITSFQILGDALGAIFPIQKIYVLIIIEGIGIIQLIYMILICPLPKPLERKGLVSWLLALSLFISVLSLCLGCIGNLILDNIWFTIGLLIAGIIGYFLTFIVNYFIKDKLMFNECYNKNTICFQYGWLIIDTFLFALSSQLSQFKVKSVSSIVKITLFLGYIIFYYIIQHVIIVEIMKITSYIQFTLLIIYAICYFKIDIYEFSIPIYFLQQLQYITIAIYNTVGTPPPFGPYSSAFVSSQNKLANVFNTGINRLPKQVIQILCPCGLFVGFLVISQIGPFHWEEGKLFFSWKRARKMKTFAILEELQKGPQDDIIVQVL